MAALTTTVGQALCSSLVPRDTGRRCLYPLMSAPAPAFAESPSLSSFTPLSLPSSAGRHTRTHAHTCSPFPPSRGMHMQSDVKEIFHPAGHADGYGNSLGGADVAVCARRKTETSRRRILVIIYGPILPHFFAPHHVLPFLLSILSAKGLGETVSPR